MSRDADRVEVPSEPDGPPDAAVTLCALASRLGIASLRAPLLALRVARLHAVLAGRDAVEDSDLALAAALVLAPRACCWPQEAQETPDDPAEPPPEQSDEAGPVGQEGGEDRLLAAAAASLPPGLLARLVAGGGPRTRSPGAGRMGAAASAQRGRPVGTRPGDPRRGRLALIETLRAAAPWQRLRRGEGEARLRITADDLRIRRLVQKRETTTIFAVDASGSAALERLAEAKGAVESLLAECYVRRDRVALVAFRGRGADLLLVPTRSLVRAKRALASLPGGGGTPLAAGIEAAGRLAAAERRSGRSPVVLLLTDGRANVDRSGAPGRAQAAADALAAARALAAEGTRALVIDTAARPQDSARALAAAMAARYLAMPLADAARLTQAVREAAPHADRDGPIRRQARLRAGGPRLAEPRSEPLRLGRRPDLARAGGGRGPGPAPRPRHGGCDPFLARAHAAARPRLPCDRPRPAGSRLHRSAADALAAAHGEGARRSAARLDVGLRSRSGHSAGAAILARLCLDGGLAPRLLVGLNAALKPFPGMAGFIFPAMARALFLNR